MRAMILCRTVPFLMLLSDVVDSVIRRNIGLFILIVITKAVAIHDLTVHDLVTFFYEINASVLPIN
jgi:hypothetical protein